MKKTTVILLGAGAIVAGLMARYVYRNILLAQDFDFNFEGWTPSAVQLSGSNSKIAGKVALSIINKSDIIADIKDIEIQVFTQGVRLGAIERPNPVRIAAKGSSLLIFEISVDPKSIMDNWRVLASAFIGTKNIPMDFVGRLKVKTAIGYVSVPIRYSTTGKDLVELYKQYY